MMILTKKCTIFLSNMDLVRSNTSELTHFMSIKLINVRYSCVDFVYFLRIFRESQQTSAYHRVRVLHLKLISLRNEMRGYSVLPALASCFSIPLSIDFDAGTGP